MLPTHVVVCVYVDRRLDTPLSWFCQLYVSCYCVKLLVKTLVRFSLRQNSYALRLWQFCSAVERCVNKSTALLTITNCSG